MSEISKYAVIDPAAKIGADVTIGPFCVIGPDVVIGDGCELMNNVTIQGETCIGVNNIIYPNVVIGAAPQDLKYDGAPTKTIIGYGNVFRENATVHRGTELGIGETVIGNENLLMVSTHVAHDCVIGNHVILGNQTQLAGHVKIEDGAVISALIGLHHFVTVGKFSYVAGLTPVRRDVPPFMKFSGDPNGVRGVNEEGLKRNGFSSDDIGALKEAYRLMFRQGPISTVLNEFEGRAEVNDHVRYLCAFMKKSCDSRLGRYEESCRRDKEIGKRNRKPLEVRKKDRRKVDRD
ncbi:MAG: acyl-ACP--UDP-N-acetylglucosamine O-acyltransferase [Sedimentisphaerales bacterium]|nr:acyl-ACP--UDP-N-acetylglucosamine O-acyltransferase [Sedimentisphaerales bacterium]